MKKLISLILAFILLVGVLPQTALNTQAEEITFMNIQIEILEQIVDDCISKKV